VSDIKFRGRRVDNGEWVYGGLWISHANHCYIEDEKQLFWVKRDTVGQFTGLPDTKGKDMYVDDIVYSPYSKEFSIIKFGKYRDRKDSIIHWGFYSVRFLGKDADDDGMYDPHDCCGLFDINDRVWCEVVGDIHQHTVCLGKIIKKEEMK